ncbi:winged helix-turn-helix domain-containing protein [Patescibacteria group bacterium]|nr:winged helix-turn-helix domain-containing protein [Patescibacteria group bacterium]MBU1931411.1 winged helix-turn-helix domain-containing protein [Patescibacteria group bacterium]
MSKLLPPITPESFEKMVSQWARIVKYRESGSIYYYSKSGLLYRLRQLFADEKLYSKYFGGKKIQIVDLESVLIEDQEDVVRVFEKSKSNIFFILAADKIWREQQNKLLDYLANLGINFNISFLLFFQADFNHPDIESIFQTKNLFLQNLVFHPLPSKKDGRQLIRYLENKWQVKIDQKTQQIIVDQCGGYLWLIKEAVRYWRDNNQLSFDHEDMNLRLQLIWKYLLDSEKQVLEKVVLGNKDFNSLEKHSFEFLQKTDWLPLWPLLEKFIHHQLKKIDLRVTENGQIVLKEVLIDRMFSPKERRVLKFLLSKKDRLVSRDEIAQAVLGNQWENNYSDWAIDQTISRLRKKLAGLSISPKIIKTIRGKGLVFKEG